MSKACGKILLVGALALPLASAAWARHDPRADWRQQATGHFLLVYPAMAADAAGQASVVAETAFPQVRDLFGHAPVGRTVLVLNSLRDDANGLTQTIFQKMEFNLAPPVEKWDGTRDRSWLQSLMFHEFAHLCYGTRREGFAGLLTDVFGNLDGVNFVAPGWWVEGVAEFSETALTEGGRGRNPYHAMRLAANLLSEEAWSLGQAGNSPRFDFPFDRTYLAGYDLVAAYGEQAGNGFLDRAGAQQSAWPFLGLFDVWKRAGGMDLFSVQQATWNRKKTEFNQRFGAVRPAMPGATAVTAEAHALYHQPHWTNSGDLTGYRESTDSAPALVRVHPGALTPEVLATPALVSGRVAYQSATQTFYYARLLPDPFYDGTLTADLFAWNAGGERRLTVGGRCWSPDISAQGRVVCVVNRWNATQLALLDAGNGRLSPIPALPGATYLSPRWSPDGRRLAAAVRIDGIQDVCLVDAESGTLTALTGWDPAGDHDPVWSPDGQTLFFVSDRSGVHQIYAYGLSSARLFQVTDARLGAFDPEISPDGRQLAFAEYRPGNQQQWAVAPLDAKDWKPVSAKPATSIAPAAPVEFSQPAQPGEAYSPWPHLLPTFWLPTADVGQDGLLWGVFSARQDPLELHAWQARLLLQPANGKIYGDLAYSNGQLPLLLTAKVYSSPLSYWRSANDPAVGVKHWARAQGVNLIASLPVTLFRSERETRSFQLELAQEAFKLSEADADAQPDAQYRGLTGSILFADLCQSPRDLFPISGISAAVSGRRAWPGHAFDGRSTQLGLIGYLPSWAAHQSLRLSTTWSANAGTFADAPSDILPRGYPQTYSSGYTSLVSCAYQFPICYIDNGPGLFPIFFHALWLELFAEKGAAWNGYLRPADWLQSAMLSGGYEAHLDMEAFWYLSARLNHALIFKPGEIQATLGMVLGF